MSYYIVEVRLVTQAPSSHTGHADSFYCCRLRVIQHMPWMNIIFTYSSSYHDTAIFWVLLMDSLMELKRFGWGST